MFDFFRGGEREETFSADRCIGHQTVEAAVTLKIAADFLKLFEICQIGENRSNAVRKLGDGLGKLRRFTARNCDHGKAIGDKTPANCQSQTARTTGDEDAFHGTEKLPLE